MNQVNSGKKRPVYEVTLPAGTSPIVLVCEHASAFIPAAFDNLGLADEALTSHAAWDPGALGVALKLSQSLDAVLVASCISRLVYDCNRPPGHPGAMPERSEVFDVPGNTNLTDAARQSRHDTYYLPFRNAVEAAISAKPKPVMVTMHSFNPVYHGVPREVEIGILHADDARVADAMLDCARAHTDHIVRRNEPYGPTDGVTHTVAEHATPQGHPNVMIEVRNDLIQTPEAQAEMARQLTGWLTQALSEITGGDGWTV